MNNLPDLPFELILGCLSLEEQIKCKAVSRRFYHVISRFRPTSLFFSDRPSPSFIFGKRQLISSEYASNFVSSPRFDLFFNAFGQSMLSSLKHLRLCDLDLHAESRRMFMSTLNSFSQLEELGIFRFKLRGDSEQSISKFWLNLPMLNSIQLEDLPGIKNLTLDTPRLVNIKFYNRQSNLSLDIVHAESVERLIIWTMEGVAEVANLTNLQYFWCDESFGINSTFLSSLKQLKEIHLARLFDVKALLEQKRRYCRADLNIFCCGCLLNGPEDPALRYLGFFDSTCFRFLVENESRLAEELPFYKSCYYSAILNVAPGLEAILLKRLTHLNSIDVDIESQDTDRFLELLKNFSNIVELEFRSNRPQDLFDRLPDHFAAQKLTLMSKPASLQFLFRFYELIFLDLRFSIDAETTQTILASLQFLKQFNFFRDRKYVKIEIDHHPRRFNISTYRKRRSVSDLSDAIQVIFNVRQPKKRKAEVINRPTKSSRAI